MRSGTRDLGGRVARGRDSPAPPTTHGSMRRGPKRSTRPWSRSEAARRGNPGESGCETSRRTTPPRQPPTLPLVIVVACDLQGLMVAQNTQNWWREWSNRCSYQGKWRDAVLRSLITLKALTFSPTGGITAAPTTSLPELPGGVRNWDYRFCWVRDATLTLNALLNAGYHDEARAWREWLLRAIAGSPSELNIVYGLRGTQAHGTRASLAARVRGVGASAHRQRRL